MFNQPVVYEYFGSSSLGDSPYSSKGSQPSNDMGHSISHYSYQYLSCLHLRAGYVSCKLEIAHYDKCSWQFIPPPQKSHISAGSSTNSKSLQLTSEQFLLLLYHQELLLYQFLEVGLLTRDFIYQLIFMMNLLVKSSNRRKQLHFFRKPVLYYRMRHLWDIEMF